jgi:hypothetical protein
MKGPAFHFSMRFLLFSFQRTSAVSGARCSFLAKSCFEVKKFFSSLFPKRLVAVEARRVISRRPISVNTFFHFFYI